MQYKQYKKRAPAESQQKCCGKNRQMCLVLTIGNVQMRSTTNVRFMAHTMKQILISKQSVRGLPLKGNFHISYFQTYELN